MRLKDVKENHMVIPHTPAYMRSKFKNKVGKVTQINKEQAKIYVIFKDVHDYMGRPDSAWFHCSELMVADVNTYPEYYV